MNYKEKITKGPVMLQISGYNFSFPKSKEVVFKLTRTEGGANGRK